MQCLSIAAQVMRTYLVMHLQLQARLGTDFCSTMYSDWLDLKLQVLRPLDESPMRHQQH